ncbi:MAG: DUF3552 domain-containing protein, partial [Verrucomicrobia bacterium]|nr:DUF3552 domain-containing protein [Verrucomicrobiota bacterium]
MFVLGIVVGLILFFLVQHYRLRTFRDIAAALIKQAEERAKQVVHETTTRATQLEVELKGRIAKETQEIEKISTNIKVKEEKLDREKGKLQQRLLEVEKHDAQLSQKAKALDAKALELTKRAGLSQEEAKELLFEELRKELEQESALFLLTRQQQDQQQADQKALHLMVEALGRLPRTEHSEHFITELLLPNEEMKAKIIGREGKNIKAFQQVTGVSVVIDETPLTLFLSCFDATRREIAKLALERLIKDGQINPSKIEEAVAAATCELDEALL